MAIWDDTSPTYPLSFGYPKLVIVGFEGSAPLETVLIHRVRDDSTMLTWCFLLGFVVAE